MDDYIAKLFAGHMGISAVLANVLIDKGLVTSEELTSRLRQAHGAATQSASGLVGGHALAELIRYLDQQRRRRTGAHGGAAWVARSSTSGRRLDAVERRLASVLAELRPPQAQHRPRRPFRAPLRKTWVRRARTGLAASRPPHRLSGLPPESLQMPPQLVVGHKRSGRWRPALSTGPKQPAVDGTPR